jgi:hypothetical protein
VLVLMPDLVRGRVRPLRQQLRGATFTTGWSAKLAEEPDRVGRRSQHPTECYVWHLSVKSERRGEEETARAFKSNVASHATRR